MDGIRPKQQTKLYTNNTWSSIPIHGIIRWPRPIQPHSNNKRFRNKISHHNNKYIQSVTKKLLLLSLGVITCTPAYATDVGGVSATANPIANSSGSVTNQAIQVLQGPYITNTYGGGIQCQGATMNMTPYFTGSLAQQHPFEEIYMDPVYNNADNDDDNIPDNPGEILYHIPTRTGQKNNTNISLGLSATWSRPLDKKLQEQCKKAVNTQIAAVQQLTANKRLDFEIARLKNCGELMKQGIMFHPKSPYAAVCADVMLVQPPNVIVPHAHSLTSSLPVSQNLSEASPSSPDTYSSESEKQKDEKVSSQESTEPLPWSFSRGVLSPSKEGQQEVSQEEQKK